MDLLHYLDDHLLENRRRDREAARILDEGQAILDRKLFEELGPLLRFQLNGPSRLTPVRMGQPQLAEGV